MGVASIVESAGFLAPGRTCDFGRLRPLALHRVPPAGPACGLFRGDGFGDEYSRRICRSVDFGGAEEGDGGEKALILGPNSVSFEKGALKKSD